MVNITNTRVIIAVAVFLLLFANLTFFQNVVVVYPITLSNILFLASLFVAFLCVNILLLSLIAFKYTIKPVLTLLLLVSSQSAYFMDTYHVILNDSMIDNAMNTDVNEAADLLSFKQLLYLLLLGVVPSLIIYRLDLSNSSLKRSLIGNVKLFAGALLTLVAVMLLFSDYYASFLREHKKLRFYSNPSYYIYSVVNYLNSASAGKGLPLQAVGTDAKLPEHDIHRELVLFVVGETARADHFALNGYTRKTNPLLAQEKVISFKDVWSCGTSTALSVPCMFSIYTQDDYSDSKAKVTENVLDVLTHTGANVVWLDNNSDSKGVADRVEYISYKNPVTNPVCDSECRDEGMLANLQAYIDTHPSGDIFVVLHQMGNHGPAYYKRYPERFAQFTPVCKTNQLEQCSSEEINNAYDNAILYTDYFLSQVIRLLEKNSAEKGFESAMVYASDHGESLGENHLYLHGLPYMFAPDTQKHVPMIMWFSENLISDEVDFEKTRSRSDEHLTHDNLFHTILGLMEVGTAVYDPKMDIIDYDIHYDR